MPQYALKQSQTARKLLFLMVDSTDHVTGKTGLSPTVTLSKNGAAFASPAGAVTELSSGWYAVAGNATDTATLGPLLLHATGTAADPTDAIFEVVAYDPDDGVRLGLTSLPNAAAGANGGLPTGNASGQVVVSSHATGAIATTSFAAGAIDAAAIATDAIGSAELAASAVTEIQTAVAAGAVASVTGAVGSIAAGGIATTSFAAGAINAAAIATDAIGAAELAADAVTEIQSGLATAAALATVQADTDNIQTRLPAALVSGRMDSDVGAIQSGAITAASIATDALGALELAAGAATEIAAAVWDEARAGHVTAGTFGQGVASVQGSVTGAVGSVASGGIAAASFAAGAIDAAAIATDAIGSAELAADAVTEIQSGLATAAALVTAQADLDDIQTRLPVALVGGRMDSDVGAVQADAIDAASFASATVLEIVDALLTRDMSVVTGEADRSLLNALRFIRNKWSIGGTTLTVTKEDDITTAWTATIVGTAGADPVTAVDPA